MSNNYCPSDTKELSQEVVAEGESWLLARHDTQGNDTQSTLDSLGFIVFCVCNDLFYQVQPPAGWNKSRHGFREDIRDDKGIVRINNYPIIWDGDTMSIRDVFLKLT